MPIRQPDNTVCCQIWQNRDAGVAGQPWRYLGWQPLPVRSLKRQRLACSEVAVSLSDAPPLTGLTQSLAATDQHCMLLGDMRIHLVSHKAAQLKVARQRCACFWGLLRWCRRTVSDPSRGSQHAFNRLGPNAAGQYLLVQLSMLPDDLADKIAVVAGIQHDLVSADKVDLSLA